MGIAGFMNALKLGRRQYNILINTVAPLAATRLAFSTGVFPEQIVPFLKPELVTPLVAYLCSDRCQKSGNIISAGGGYFSRVQMLEGPGVRFHPEDEITPDVVADNYDAILNMEGAVSFDNTKDVLRVAFGPLMRQSCE